MDAETLGDLVCLHLAGVADATDGAPQWSSTAAGISEAIRGETETVADRVELLSTLEDLERSGHVDRTLAPVEGTDDQRTVYRPTEAGRERAGTVRERLSEVTVSLSDGEGRRVPIDEATSLLGGDAGPTAGLVRTAARADDDGVVRVPGDVREDFLGHDEELARLRSAVDGTVRQGRTTVVVGGEAGVGKTPLVSRTVDYAESQGYVTVETRARRAATDPFGPFERLFEVLSDRTGVDSPFRKTPPAEDDPEAFAARRRAFLDDVAAGLRDAATERPVCLVVEDLQWADATTLELFAHVSRVVTGWIFPVLLVGTYRTGAVGDGVFADVLEDLSSTPGFEHVRLAPLSRDETERLATHLAGRDLPGSFLDGLHETTGGNPFFVRETVSTLLDAGALDDRPEAALAGLDAADAVGAAVDRRLDALDDTGRDLLGLLAVAGGELPRSVLAAAVDADAPRFREYVDVLSASGVLETTADAVRFRSRATAEAVRDRAGTPRTLHHRIAAAYEDTFEDLAGYQGTVAHHYERAGEYAAAVEARTAAAEAAARVYANDAATDEYERALDLLDEVPSTEADDYRRRILPELAGCHLLTADFAAAERVWERLRDIATAPATRVRAARGLFEVRRKRGEFEAALSVAEEGMSVDPPDGDRSAYDRERFRLIEAEIWPHLRRGNVDRARELLDRYAGATDGVDAAERRPQVLDVLAGVELFERNVETAIRHWETSIDLLSGDPSRELAASQSRLAVTYLQTGRYHEALELLDDAVRIERSRGDALNRTIVESNYAYALERLGRWDEAIDRYETCLDRARRLGIDRDAAFVRSRRGTIRVVRGEIDAGREDIVRSLETALEQGHDRQEVMSRVSLARLELLVGDVEAALAEAETAADVADRVDPLWEGAALAIAGDAHLGAGRPGDARGVYRDALGIAEECPVPWVEAAAESGMARVHATDGDDAAAREAAERAWTLATDLGEPLVVVRTGRTLARRLHEGGDEERAVSVLESATEVAADVGATTFEASALLTRAAIDERAGDHAAAERRRSRARSLLNDRAFECVAALVGET